MSLDAFYIFVYDKHNYAEPSPMIQDKDYLLDKYGGCFECFDFGYSMYWNKPKYLLPLEELNHLNADQVLERKESELWSIIK